jgi:hypothetical protein
LKNNQGNQDGPGGKRNGAGRRKGERNKRTERAIAKAEAEGILPLDVMLDNMRWAYGQARALDQAIEELIKVENEPGPFKEADRLADLTHKAMAARSNSQEWATDAAEFVHPKLRSVENSGAIVHKIEKIEIEYVRATHAKE